MLSATKNAAVVEDYMKECTLRPVPEGPHFGVILKRLIVDLLDPSGVVLMITHALLSFPR